MLSGDEVEALVCHFGKGMKPSELTIGQAVLWIGRLGGHPNRKRDGMPGVRTLWRGLHDLACSRLLRRQESRRIVVGNAQSSQARGSREGRSQVSASPSFESRETVGRGPLRIKVSAHGGQLVNSTAWRRSVRGHRPKGGPAGSETRAEKGTTR